MSRHETILQYAKTVLLSAILVLAVWSFGNHQPKVEAQGGASAGYSYTHITTAANTLVKSAGGTLHTITVNTATGTASIFDTSVAACTGGSTVAITGTLATVGQSIVYDIQTTNGICITTTGSPDLTVTWR